MLLRSATRGSRAGRGPAPPIYVRNLHDLFDRADQASSFGRRTGLSVTLPFRIQIFRVWLGCFLTVLC